MFKLIRLKIKILFKQLPFFWAIKFTTVEIFRTILTKEARLLFAQTGEDIIISNYFHEKRDGFYIEVGASHPLRFSNSFFLYLRGWKGILIDANKDLVDKASQIRVNDLCVHTAVSDYNGEVTFHIFDEYLVSTMDEDQKAEWQKKWNIVESKTVPCATLDSILEDKINITTQIDFLSIDTEGNDLNVLKGLNLNKYRPKLIVIEIHNFNIENIEENDIYVYLKNNSYKLIGYIIMNAYFAPLYPRQITKSLKP